MALALTVGLCMPALAQLRVCTWNVTNYASNGTSPSNSRDADFQNAIYGLVPAGLELAGKSMSPDVLICTEFMTATSVSTFVGLLNSAPGSPGDWAAAPFLDGPDTDSAFFYRTGKVQYLGTWTIALGSSSTCNQPRHTRRYDFRPVGYTSAAASIGAYSIHLKAQGSNSACPGGENAEGRRLVECQRIRANASGVDTNPGWTSAVGGSNPAGSSALPAGFQIIVAGDTNIQSSTRPDYQELVGVQANNVGRFFDPIASPGTWNNSSAFRFIHTQDPASSAGMDDRHDQLLVGAGLLDGTGLEYIFVPGAGGQPQTFSTGTWNDLNHSYRCWGNDGTSFNTMLRTTGNVMVGASIAQSLRNSASVAGHLPVLMDLRVPAKASAPMSISFGQVPQNSSATRMLVISNSGDVARWTIAGIDVLRYSLMASAGFGAPAGEFVDGAGGGANSHTITMDTSLPGIKSGTVTITTNDPDRPTVNVVVTGEVTPDNPPNLPPIADAGPDQVVNNQSGSGSQSVTLDGGNSADPDGVIVSYRWSEGPMVLAAGPSPTAMVDLPAGVHSILLTVFDNGGLTGTDTVEVLVNRRPVAAAGGDQTVIDSDGGGDEVVTLDGSGSTDADGSIVEYRWSEGAMVLAMGGTPTAMVTLPVGPHAVTLRVTDNHGAFHEDTVAITVDPAPPSCPADFNGDGNLDPDDLSDYITCFFSEVPFPGLCPEADFNQDGNVDPDDLSDYVTAFFAGC